MLVNAAVAGEVCTLTLHLTDGKHSTPWAAVQAGHPGAAVRIAQNAVRVRWGMAGRRQRRHRRPADRPGSRLGCRIRPPAEAAGELPVQVTNSTAGHWREVFDGRPVLSPTSQHSTVASCSHHTQTSKLQSDLQHNKLRKACESACCWRALNREEVKVQNSRGHTSCCLVAAEAPPAAVASRRTSCPDGGSGRRGLCRRLSRCGRRHRRRRGCLGRGLDDQVQRYGCIRLHVLLLSAQPGQCSKQPEQPFGAS